MVGSSEKWRQNRRLAEASFPYRVDFQLKAHETLDRINDMLEWCGERLMRGDWALSKQASFNGEGTDRHRVDVRRFYFKDGVMALSFQREFGGLLQAPSKEYRETCGRRKQFGSGEGMPETMTMFYPGEDKP